MIMRMRKWSVLEQDIARAGVGNPERRSDEKDGPAGSACYVREVDEKVLKTKHRGLYNVVLRLRSFSNPSLRRNKVRGLT